MDKPNTPMVRKAEAVLGETRMLLLFVNWLSTAGHLAVALGPDRRPTAEDLVAQFQGIDLIQLAAERRELTKWAHSGLIGDGLGEGRRPGD